MTEKELLDKAFKAAENSYSPYSGFKVGAALECADGDIFLGCNVENASYGVTNCAERTALFSAVAAGKREFARIAVASPNAPLAYPCGVCLQALSEFMPTTADIILEGEDGSAVKFTLERLLPMAFKL